MSQQTIKTQKTPSPKAGLLKSTMILSLLVSAVLGCAPIRNSPFSDQVDAPFANLNENSRGLLPTYPMTENSAFQFSIFADAHANYDDLSNVVGQLNATPSLFTVNLGDVTDLGLALEYEAFVSHITQLQKPLFSIIGNHDAIGNGKAIYQNLFGSLNYHFDFNGIRFVFFNNNSLDFLPGNIDLDWLQRTVSDSENPVLLFQHVDPLNPEYFTLTQREKILEILDSKKVVAVFHGHLHQFKTYEVNGVLVQQVGRVEGGQYSLIDVKENTLTVTNCRQGGSCETFNRNFGTIVE